MRSFSRDKAHPTWISTSFVLFGILFCHSANGAVTELNDVLSLRSFKNKLSNPELLSNWNGDPCLDGWIGIQCAKVKDAAGSVLAYSVVMIWLPKMQLHGTLTAAVGKMENLGWLNLATNKFYGEVPHSFGRNGKLLLIDLANNDFEGEFTMVPTSKLFSLNLSGNRLSGVIDGPSFAPLPNLQLLNVSHNLFTGPIPQEFTSLRKLEILALDNNKLTGGIPPGLTDLPNLRNLKLQNNNLSGTVTNGFKASLNAEYYGNPGLCVENSSGECVSVSTFNGSLPSIPSLLNDFCNGTSRACHCENGEEGTQTCAQQVGWGSCSCDNQIQEQESTMPSSQKTRIPWYYILVIDLVGVCILLAILYAIFWICKINKDDEGKDYKATSWDMSKTPKGRSKVVPMDVPSSSTDSHSVTVKDSMQDDSYPLTTTFVPHEVPQPPPKKAGAMTMARTWSKQQNPNILRESNEVYVDLYSQPAVAPEYRTLQRFTFQQLREATNDFSVDNVLGNDGISRVYRALLQDGSLAVVKELDPTNKDMAQLEDFIDDVSVFGELDHRNLVNVIGYCAEEDSRLVVLEYVPNGSLDLHLHGPNMDTVMDWNTRMHTVLCVARGLEFLHEQDPPIAHQELRSTNVLLDVNFDAKLSDYALFLLTGQVMTSQTTANLAVSAGTAAPELAWSQEFTAETDVYAFGVLLLEVMTGRRPFDSKRPPNEQALVRWARPRLTERNRVESLVDWKLGGVYSSPALYQIALLAWQCIQVDAATRPNMTQVVEVLQKLQNLPMDSVVELAEEKRVHDFLSLNSSENSAEPLYTQQPQVMDLGIRIAAESTSHSRSQSVESFSNPGSMTGEQNFAINKIVVTPRESQYDKALVQPFSPVSADRN